MSSDKSKTIVETTTITALNHQGAGVARIDGKTIFVEGALPEEEVELVRTRRHKNYDQARLENILTTSSNRTTPPCQHAGTCGGCTLQHLTSKAQLAQKTEWLLEQLRHFGGVTPLEIAEPITGPTIGYRRRARLSVKYVQKKGKCLIGFHEKDPRFVMDMVHCSVLDPRLAELITPLKTLIETLSIYTVIPQIELSAGDDTVAFIIRHLKPFSKEEQIALHHFGEIHGVYMYLQPGGLASIHRITPDLKITAQAMTYTLPEFNLTFTFEPTDFLQINSAINQKLVTRAMQWLDPTPKDHCLDLFCGLGNFSLPMARKAKHVIGIEGESTMVTRAQHNALNNQINNTNFLAIDLSSTTPHPALTAAYDKILLDPPRTGAAEVISHLQHSKVQRMVYVSCNPATLARDAGLLAQQGYQLTQICVVDMFPHTAHVEACAVFNHPKR